MTREEDNLWLGQQVFPLFAQACPAKGNLQFLRTSNLQNRVPACPAMPQPVCTSEVLLCAKPSLPSVFSCSLASDAPSGGSRHLPCQRFAFALWWARLSHS
eukprot:EG_transcript_54243